jgi:hypothetical protein
VSKNSTTAETEAKEIEENFFEKPPKREDVKYGFKKQRKNGQKRIETMGARRESREGEGGGEGVEGEKRQRRREKEINEENRNGREGKG